MADKIEEKPAAAAPAKPAAAKPSGDDKPMPRVAKIVEETGRYVCRTAITFTNDKGERAHAKPGDVVGVSPDDVKYLKKIGAIVEETREE